MQLIVLDHVVDNMGLNPVIVKIFGQLFSLFPSFMSIQKKIAPGSVQRIHSQLSVITETDTISVDSDVIICIR